MIKVVKRPKEYIAIKVPRTCEDVGKFVSNEAEKAGIRLDVTTYYAVGKLWATKVGVKNVEAQTVKRGSVIVCEISQDGSKYPESVDVMDQDEYTKVFEEKPDVESIDGGAFISGGTIGSDTHIRLGNHIYATIGPNGLTVMDTGDGTVNMSELDRTIKALANALKRSGYWFSSANKDD